MTSYKDAGVDIDLADRFTELIKPYAARTHKSWRGDKMVMGGVGGFAAIMRACDRIIGKSMDGVGTKVKIASALGKFDTIGQDLVAMCANDLWVTMEPEEAFFTDYYGVGKLKLEDGERIIASIADACRLSGVALVGGETAEMPLVYDSNEFELVGDIVGITADELAVARPKQAIAPGMCVWGYPSNGVHSNGFSAIHRIFDIDYSDMVWARAQLNTFYPELGCTLGEELLRPTTLYPHLISGLRYRYGHCIEGFAHITGGGLLRNIRRILPDDCTAIVELTNVPRRPIFDLIEKTGGVKWLEMHRTFNCGIGLVAVSIADLDSWGFVRLGTIVPRFHNGREVGDKGLIIYSAKNQASI